MSAPDKPSDETKTPTSKSEVSPAVEGKDAFDPEDEADLATDDGDGRDDEVDQAIAKSKASTPVLFGGKRLPETLTALNVYLAKLKDVEILPIEEQRELAARYQQHGDKEAAAKLVASNLRLVVKIAFQFRRQWADVMDLISEGNLGLAEAMRKFDVDRGIPFPSYARFWIRARILAFIQENKHLIHAGSRAARKLFWRLERERRKLIQEGKEPTSELLAERVGVKTADVEELAPILDHRPVSLDVPVHGDEDGRTRGEILADQGGYTPEENVSGREVHGHVKQAFDAFRATLDKRDQAIWDQRLQAESPVRLEDLGDEFGVSKERVRQLEVRIKARLKKYLEKNLGGELIIQALR